MSQLMFRQVSKVPPSDGTLVVMEGHSSQARGIHRLIPAFHPI